MKKHFVTFYSPGTFVHEETTKEIESWNVDQAVAMSKEIKERYGATPFGFRFKTRERGQKDFDSKQTAESGWYFLGGKIRTRAQVEADNDPKEEILRSNMRGNNIAAVIENTNSWKVTVPFDEINDVVLN